MHLFLVLAMTAITPAVAADQPPAAKADAPSCEKHRSIPIAKNKAIGARALGVEPDAKHIKAVVRKLDGCNRPIVLQEVVGFRGR